MPLSRPPKSRDPVTGPRRRMVRWLYTHRTTMKWLRYNSWKCQRAVRHCTGGCPLENACNKGPSSPLHSGGGHGPVLSQGSGPMWAKLSLRPPRQPRTSYGLPFIHTRRHYHPPSLPTVWEGPLDRLAPLSRATRSLRPTPPPESPTPTAIRSGKKIQTTHERRGVPAQHVPFFYTPSHLSELRSFKLIISTHVRFIFIFK